MWTMWISGGFSVDNVEKQPEGYRIKFLYVYKLVEKGIWDKNIRVFHEFCRLLR